MAVVVVDGAGLLITMRLMFVMAKMGWFCCFCWWCCPCLSRPLFHPELLFFHMVALLTSSSPLLNTFKVTMETADVGKTFIHIGKVEHFCGKMSLG